jgi:hypothetical protein
MRNFILVLFMCFFVVAKGQESQSMTKVTYHEFNSEGRVNDSKLDMHVTEKLTHLSTPQESLRNFQDFGLRQMVTIAKFEDQLFATSTSFDEMPHPEFIDSTINILEYDCSQARGTPSNQKFKAAPTPDTSQVQKHSFLKLS